MSETGRKLLGGAEGICKERDMNIRIFSEMGVPVNDDGYGTSCTVIRMSSLV